MTFPRPKFGTEARRSFHQRPGNFPSRFLRKIPREPDSTSTDALARDDKLARLEATLFLADEPLTARRLADVAGMPDGPSVRRGIDRLRELYESDGTAFQIEELAGGFQLLTRPAFHSWLVRFRRSGPELRLTPATLETLAIIAYKQPVLRHDVEAVRGVQCSEIIRILMERGLVRIAGRHPSLGRPQLYGTTKKFLQVFGLKSLDDLPQVAELRVQ